MSQKFLDLAGLTAYDKKLKEWFKSGVVDITEDAIRALFVEGPANNEIWYISSDGNIVTPDMAISGGSNLFGTNIVSNTYENGKGVITCDGDVTSVGDYAFQDRYKLSSITIPNSVTSIGIGAFQNCSSLTSVTIPNSVTSIGNSAFKGCKGLTSITIPNSVTSIGGSAFESCYSLTSITIPNSVTSIEYQTFEYCNYLISVTIPEGVTSIGNLAFYDCRRMTSITYEGTTEQWNAITKGGDWNTHVPATYVQCTDGQVQL